MRDLSLHLMDIMQNSISAKANNINVSISADLEKDKLTMEISDDGVGMDEEMLSKVTDPFVTTRSTRKVGLGISLLKASAKMASGGLSINSVKGEGTSLKADFKIGNIDRIPLGDIAETISSTIMAYPGVEIKLNLDSPKGHFEFNTPDVRKMLGEVPIDQFEVITWIREYINEGIKISFGGVLDEVNS